MVILRKLIKISFKNNDVTYDSLRILIIMNKSI